MDFSYTIGMMPHFTRSAKWLAVSLSVSFMVGVGCATPRTAGLSQPVWNVCFSPRGGCTDLVVNTLAQARSTVLVQAYSFTSQPIAQALVDTHRRGVQVEVIVDKSQPTARGNQLDFVAQAGIPVRIDAAHAIAHNKIMVIDAETVITGSFNFTEAAEKSNAENLLVIENRALAEKYEWNWKKHEGHSEPYTP